MQRSTGRLYTIPMMSVDSICPSRYQVEDMCHIRYRRDLPVHCKRSSQLILHAFRTETIVLPMQHRLHVQSPLGCICLPLCPSTKVVKTCANQKFTRFTDSDLNTYLLRSFAREHIRSTQENQGGFWAPVSSLMEEAAHI